MDFEQYADLALNYVSEYSLKILAALLIFVIGKWISRKLSHVIKAMMLKAKVDLTLSEFTESLIFFTLLAMVILASLNALGVNTTSFIAVFGAASLAVGLALQGSLSNVGAAVLIIIFRPFKIGDFIEAGGATGTVEDITMFSTIMSPIDNRTIIVPNSKIIGDNIINYSKKNQRRVDLTFGIGYDDDLKAAKQILLDILNTDERILKEPAPFVAVSELGESSVNFITRAWVDTPNYWDVHFDTIEKVKLTFDEKGITIPYPQMDVHMREEKQ